MERARSATSDCYVSPYTCESLFLLSSHYFGPTCRWLAGNALKDLGTSDSCPVYNLSVELHAIVCGDGFWFLCVLKGIKQVDEGKIHYRLQATMGMGNVMVLEVGSIT